MWSSWTDLNRRPHPYQGCALPLSYMSKTAKLERAAGIEPASSAWKAEVLPLNYARLPTLATTTHLSECGETWWRGKDSNLRSFRGRFTVCSLWPLGNPSNWRCIIPPQFSVSSDCFFNHPDETIAPRRPCLSGTRRIVSKQGGECKPRTNLFQRHRSRHPRSP